MKSIWITWEIQRRNRSLSRVLGSDLYEFDYHGPRLSRYLASTKKTIAALRENAYDVFFVQNPSIVLATLAVIWKRFNPTKGKLVIDFHNSGMYPKHFKFMTPWLMRSADGCIVTSEALASVVSAWGGNPLVLPDPLPVLSGVERRDLQGLSILFICSWAEDEPVEEVVSAAKLLLGQKHLKTHIYITGRPKPARYTNIGELPKNVTLTGFLSADDFDSYLASCDIILDLTTRDDCMVCGAYEGVAAGKPMLLSDNGATAAYFTRGVELTDNSAEDIVDKLLFMASDLTKYQEDIELLRQEIEDREREAIAILKQKLGVSCLEVQRAVTGPGGC